ncbi:MAG: DUF4831 family protein [Bacteroidetes bacterium]|nr:DUF4831 family protein [Bacteroidota bacterium]
MKLEFLTNSLKEKIDTIIERIQVDSMVIEKKSYRTNLIDKSDQDFASEIADKIFNLRKFRMELISGELETPYPGASLTLMLAELDRMIEENLDLFTGTTEASIEKHHFAFTPGTTPEGIICGFSKIKGILPGGNPNGEDIVITLTLPENQSLKNFTTRCDSLVEIFNGIPYRIPFLSQIKISYLSQSLYETTIPVAQYGILTRMPLDKKYLKHISSENTGGIRFIGK